MASIRSIIQPPSQREAFAMRSAFERMEFESFRIANGAIKLTTPTFQEKNEVFVPEGFQRAIGKPFGGAMGQSPISKNA